MQDYRCGTCGTNDKLQYIRCYHPGCPDGRDRAWPDDFREDMTRLVIERKQITPDSPAARQIRARLAFNVVAVTLLSCAIFAGLLCILP